MTDAYLVQIDLKRIAENFSLAERKPWDVAQVKEWLLSEGFIERADGWLCEELTLDLLDKSEVLSKREV